jgi:CO/xanthine dehydrogenase Mo-binding subunit
VDLNGTNTSFALLAAEAFGISVDQVRVIAGDTETAPYGGMSAASKVLYTTGAAVVEAARLARQQALVIASELLEAAVDDLEIVEGRVQVRGAPSVSLDIKALARKSVEDYAPVAAYGRVALSTRAPAFCAQLAEVAVDGETGDVTVERLVVIQDAGRAINPAAVAGQMLGGATQGTGWALYEQMLYDEHGQLLTGSLMDYALPDMNQAAQQMEAVIVEVPSEQGPFGARGAGEAPVVPTAAAIANALADASGVRLRDLPITAPRLAAALRAKSTSQ